MFDETRRTLRPLGGTASISVPIADDADGYLDRECPFEDCVFRFKIHGEDWTAKVRDEEVCCPFCGHTAGSDEWWTPHQIEHARAAALVHIQGQLGKALKADARRFNRRQPRGDLISMTMKVESRSQQMFLPPAATDPMQLKISCPSCACRYAVIGAAYFCPACGQSAAEQVFEHTVTGIRATLSRLDAVRAAIPDEDTAETTVRLIVENALQNAVTAFQRIAEVLFERIPSSPKARRNVFQSLSHGASLWVRATGHTYADHLSKDDLDRLSCVFQQRHLLAHRQGLVDADYITRSGDARYREGQRIVVGPETVMETVALIEALVSGMRSDIDACHSRQDRPS